MKTIISKKAFNNAIERYKKANNVVNTNIIGTVNMVLMEFGNEAFCETWKTMSEESDDSPKHVKFYAFGDAKSGEILIIDYGEHASVHLVGKGKEEYAKVLLIQRTNEGFTIVWNSDLPESRAMFYMTATDDAIVVQIICALAEKNFPAISSDAVQKSVALLMEGVTDE